MPINYSKLTKPTFADWFLNDVHEHDADHLGEELEWNLTKDADFSIADIPWDDFEIPDDLIDRLKKGPRRLKEKDLTQRIPRGIGIFDAIMEAMKLLLTAVCSVTVCGSVFAAPPPPPHYYRNDGVALAAGIVGVVRSAIAPVVYTVAPPPPPPVYYAYPPPPPPPYPFYGYPPPPPAWGPGPRVYNVPPPPPPPRHHRGRW